MKMSLLHASLLAGALSSVSAWGQTYQSTADVNTIASTFAPAPREDQQHVDNFNHLNKPAALAPSHLDQTSQVNNGGFARSIFEGSVGHLKAFAEASYPSGVPEPHYYGYAWAAAHGSFADTVAVGGAGLALGTPVSYALKFYIEGTRSTPVFELGGSLHVDALAELRLRDLSSGVDRWLSWDARNQGNGWYSVTIDTEVGHSLMVTGMLYAGASVSSSTTLARYAVADYGHSASYFLAPSVAGLNVTGASGHDFSVSAVPEPASAALLLVGLALIGLRGLRQRRC